MYEALRRRRREKEVSLCREAIGQAPKCAARRAIGYA